MNAAAQFTVTLHHLAPDARRAGAEFADLNLANVAPEKLRTLLEALAALAPTTQFPAEPELRIVGPHGRFVVQVRNGQVRVTSWTTQEAGSGLTPNRILAMIMGTEAADESDGPASGAMGAAVGQLSRRWKIAVLAIAVAGTNGVTAWLLTRPPAPPPPELLPEYRVVAPEQAARLLANFAGDFETGGNPGDRRLTIRRDGTLRWVRLGPNQTMEEDLNLTSQAAESRGRPVLVASNYGMIEMKDPITIVYFGDTYRRKMP